MAYDLKTQELIRTEMGGAGEGRVGTGTCLGGSVWQGHDHCWGPVMDRYVPCRSPTASGPPRQCPACATTPTHHLQPAAPHLLH